MSRFLLSIACLLGTISSIIQPSLQFNLQNFYAQRNGKQRQATNLNDVTTASTSPLVYTPLLDAISQSKINSSLNSSEACRVFHGRGGCYPGCEHLTLDWFPPVWVLTSFQNTRLAESELAAIGNALEEQWQADGNADDLNPVLSWVYQSRGSYNNVTTTIMSGTIPDPHVVTENGCKYLVCTDDDTGRRHRGLFLDMANGRKWLREASGGKVLNLFSYTCGFSVAALAGHAGTREVVNIDKVKGVIKIGQKNHELNGISNGSARFLSHDLFKSWGKLRKLGPFDIIVCDPPSYQKGSFVAKKDYGKLIRRLPALLTASHANNDDHATTSQVLLCLNSPELGIDFLKEQVAENAPQLKLVERIPNPTSFPVIDMDRALKVLLYEMSAKDASKE